MTGHLVPLSRDTLHMGMKNRQWNLSNLSEYSGVSVEILSNILRTQKATNEDFDKINTAFKRFESTITKTRV